MLRGGRASYFVKNRDIVKQVKAHKTQVREYTGAFVIGYRCPKTIPILSFETMQKHGFRPRSNWDYQENEHIILAENPLRYARWYQENCYDKYEDLYDQGAT